MRQEWLYTALLLSNGSSGMPVENWIYTKKSVTVKSRLGNTQHFVHFICLIKELITTKETEKLKMLHVGNLFYSPAFDS